MDCYLSMLYLCRMSYESAHRIQVEQKRAEEEATMRGKGAVDPASYWGVCV